MARDIIIAFLVSSFLVAVLPVHAGPKELPLPQLSLRVKEVDAALRKNTGIGLVGISMLMRSGSRVFLRESILSSTEKLAVDDLSKKGYVLARYVDTHEGRFLEMQPTERGDAILKVLGKDQPSALR